ncbi:hypothetical protein [Streptococcus sobrinus]|uniref:hypothetical protein n=5 Tax=Streptococcus sobrinus TaxID=1310 RepID=UPI000307D2A1|nr:hypothetical protein [Streptococcus sobrinus]
MSAEEFNSNSESAQSESLNSQTELGSEVSNDAEGTGQKPIPAVQEPAFSTDSANPQASQNFSQETTQVGQTVTNQPQSAEVVSQEGLVAQNVAPTPMAPNQPFNNAQAVNSTGVVGQTNIQQTNAMPGQVYQDPNLVNPQMAANSFNQAACVQTSQAKPGRTKKIIWSIVGALAAIFLIVGGILLYRHFSGNVDGTYQATTLQSSLKKDLKDKAFDKGKIAYSSFTDDAKVETVIKGDVVKATVSYNVSYDDFYDEVKSNFSSTYSSYKSNFSNDEWNYLMNTLIKSSDLDEKGFTKAFSSEVENGGLSYDSDKKQVSGTLFEGKVNRVSGKIEITKVNSDSKLVNFEKGEKISYKKTSDGLTLKDNNEHTINLTTE